VSKVLKVNNPNERNLFVFIPTLDKTKHYKN